MGGKVVGWVVLGKGGGRSGGSGRVVGVVKGEKVQTKG